jgi:hypothetical protein
MLEFDTEAFMDGLRKKLPNARITCRTHTDEQRAVMLGNIRAINSKNNHAPALGSGVLNRNGNERIYKNIP